MPFTTRPELPRAAKATHQLALENYNVYSPVTGSWLYLPPSSPPCKVNFSQGTFFKSSRQDTWIICI
jgi:hypothetical protein